MFHKSLHKYQMEFAVVSAILNYAPEVALLHLKSPNMLPQEAASAYTADINDSN